MKVFRILLVVTIIFLGAACSGPAQSGKKTPDIASTPTLTLPPYPVISITSPPTKTVISTPIPYSQLVVSSSQKLESFIRVPHGKVPKPYVILSGYQTLLSNSETISISGKVEEKSFFCPTSPCAVEFPESANITFQAQDKNGTTSDPIQANIHVDNDANGYSLTIITIGKYYIFSDSCANAWQTNTMVPPAWARFLQDPNELNTNKSLNYLSTRLSVMGVVDTSDCPGGGFENNLPNACRLARIKDQMVIWQNQYDEAIWQTSKEEQIPPLILKTLFETESQFWPNSHRAFLDELGLGQVNQLGMDVLLRSDPVIYQKTCSGVLSNCDIPYASHSNRERALIRGSLAQSMDATCSSCTNGVDLSKAIDSIPTVAKVLYANCLQTRSLMNLYNVSANYEDRWKLTLVSYHSGFGCLQSALKKSAVDETQLDWKTVSGNLACTGAAEYVNKFWDSLVSFNSYLQNPSNLELVKLQEPTPPPTPTGPISNSRIIVKIFFDQNGDGIQQSNEALDNVVVNLELENGLSYTQITSNGMATFSLNSISVGVRAKITLQGLYRTASVIVPSSGDVPIIFVFSKPILPTQLP